MLFSPLKRAALPAAAGAEPRVVIDSAGVFRRVQGRGSRFHRAAFTVPMAAALVAVREAVQEQKIEDLVLPGGRRRRERPPSQRSEVNVQQALLDLVGHVGLSLEPDVFSRRSTQPVLIVGPASVPTFLRPRDRRPPGPGHSEPARPELTDRHRAGARAFQPFRCRSPPTKCYEND